MRTVQPDGILAECYTKALMIEREAAARCKEFAEFLEEHGKLAIAAVFRKLYRYEWQHARYLERRAAGSPPPRLRHAEFQWLGDAPPEQVSDEVVFHMMTPYDALKIALSAWERAKGLFERVFRTTDDPRVRALAGALAAAGESEHVGWLANALAKVPRRPVSEADFERLLNQ